MQPTIEYIECLRDSPKFRKYLDEEEASVENLEQKLERTLKLCTVMVDSGKEYVKNQSAFATSLWNLNSHFKDNKSAQNALNKIITCFQDMNKFQTILLDQASCIILKNVTTFVKTDIKEVKEQQQHFNKASDTYDSALNKNAQANKSRPAEVNDAVNTLSASASYFRHMALDYVYALNTVQARKMHEILSTLLSYYQACNTFYHQGYDLCKDYEDFFKGLSNDIAIMQTESMKLDKTLQNRHATVSQYSETQLSSRPSSAEAANSSTTLAQIESQPIAQLYEGYLFKRTSKGFKSWNRRWFYLHGNQLLYVKRGKDEMPTIMEEDLRICSVRPTNDSDRRFCFEVISPTKSHTLQADSAEIMNTWIRTIRNRIDELLQTDHKILDSFPSSIPGAKKIRKIDCEQFYKIAGNERCCDCSGADPKWASINLGITLCIACSGVHRSLGVHYSKVRSLTLDGWEPEIVKVMMELGNTVINTIYEANYVDEGTSTEAGDSDASPSSPVPKITRATFDCDNSVRETWIKAKYIDKSFVIPLNELHLRSAILEETNCLSDIVFSEHGKWHIQRRSGNSITLREDKQSTNEDSASSSELSIDSNIVGDDSSIASSGSADDGDVNGGLANSAVESVENLNSDVLLYMAATIRHVPVMCYAIACGASQNWTNEKDSYRTSLHRAVLSNSVSASEFLLLNGCKINAVDENGYTSLRLATQNGFTAQAYLLLKHQAKHDIAANDNKQPIDIAVEQGNADIVTLLRLTQLNEEIGMDEHVCGEGDTYNEVMIDFSRIAVSQPHKLQRPKHPSE